jgi:glycosyltransferase involved in cell wall biosynthesis
MAQKPHVVFFQRRPIPGVSFSVEQIFDDLREDLEGRITFDLRIASKFSKGLLPRISIALEAIRDQGAVNHVTGDIHFAAIGLRRERSLLTILDTVAVDCRRGIKRHLLNLFWYQLPVRRVASVTTISEFSRSSIERIVRTNTPITVIPVAISRGFHRKPVTPLGSFPTVLLVGTREHKNVERTADALKGLKCKILIIGCLTPRQEQVLKQTGCKIENIANAQQTEVVDAYQRADLLCFCSTYEGFGMPILEAHESGVPVVTSNVASMPEVAGEAALLVNPYCARSIREGVVAILSNDSLRQSLIRAGFRNAIRYSRDEVANRYLSLYERIHTSSPRSSEA